MTARRLGSVVAAFTVAGTLAAVPVTAEAENRDGVRRELRFADPAIDESSGLVVRGDDVLTVNDSGDGPVIYVVDRTTGRTVGRTTYSSDDVEDVEALAPGRDGAVWVGDIGDNDRARSQISLYRVARVGRGDATTSSQRFDLVHPRGPQDAETLLVEPRTERVFIVTKGVFGGQVLAAPHPLRPGVPNRLRVVASVGGLVTDGTYLPGGRSVALRTYSGGYVLDAETWEQRGAFPLPAQRQSEGIAPWPDDRVLVSSEGAGSALLSAPVPRRLLAAPAAASPPKAPPGEGSSGTDQRPRSDRAGDGDDAGGATGTVIPLPAAVAGGAALVVLTLGTFWLLRRRVRGRLG